MVDLTPTTVSLTRTESWGGGRYPGEIQGGSRHTLRILLIPPPFARHVSNYNFMHLPPPCIPCVTDLRVDRSATRNRRLRWFGRCGQFTRISHIPGEGRPLLREGGPISYEATTSVFFQPHSRPTQPPCSPQPLFGKQGVLARPPLLQRPVLPGKVASGLGG